MSKEQELKEMLKLYSKQDLWNRIQGKQAMIYDLEAKLAGKDQHIKELGKENQQLRQQLHDLPKKIVKDVRDVAEDYWDYEMCKECGNIIDFHTLSKKDFDEVLATILEKYGVEK